MRVLLDRCVLSELRTSKGNAEVRRMVDSFDSDDLSLSVISIGEITKVIALLKKGHRKHALQTWRPLFRWAAG